METYLVIGGAGFIGSNLIRHLLNSSDAPRIVVLEHPKADIASLRWCYVTMVRGTLDDTELIEDVIRKFNCSQVIHLVSTMTPSSNHDAFIDELVNVVKPTINLMEVCSRLRARLVYFSSGGAIYGEGNTIEPFEETDPLKPISYYGLAKLIIESNIRFEHRVNGLQYLIIRPSNPYGNGQNIYGNQGFIAVAFGKVLQGMPITVYGDGGVIRDYIHINDLVFAVGKILINKDADNEAINIGSGVGHTLNDIILCLNNVIEDYKVDVVYTDTRKCDVSCVMLDITRMMQLTNLQPMTIQEGIKDFYQHILWMS